MFVLFKCNALGTEQLYAVDIEHTIDKKSNEKPPRIESNHIKSETEAASQASAKIGMEYATRELLIVHRRK